MSANGEILLSATDLKKHFVSKPWWGSAKTVRALDGVSFQLSRQRTLGVVGESGCGKSTLAKVLMQIESPTDGVIQLDGKPHSQVPIREYRRAVQMIFQDPYGSLNPRKKAGQIIAEPLHISAEFSNDTCRTKVLEMMDQVGLRPEMVDRYPHMFSGGQRQRIGIARALILRPRVLICDEPVSALDVSIQAQVINLLIELQDAFGLSFIFISHDLSVVQHVADDVLVMYLGKVVETGSRHEIFANPLHPYTKALLQSTPVVRAAGRRTRTVLSGELPSPVNPPSGCAFHKRCPIAEPRCATETPALLEKAPGRTAACHLV